MAAEDAAADPVVYRASDIYGGRGINPSVCVHPNGCATVMAYSRKNILYYKVGRVNKRAKTITWGREVSHGTGCHPSVALIRHDNNSYVVIAVYSGSRTCYYCVGAINVEALSIEWGNCYDLNRGLMPKVCANDNRTVLVIEEQAGAKIQYRIGNVDINQKSINWQMEFQRLHEIERGVQPVIAMNGNIVMVVYCKGSYLNIIIGALEARRKISWGNSACFGEGKNPSVCINAHGFIIEVHQSIHLRRLFHNVGVVDREHRRITWNEPRNQRCGLGKKSVISLCNDGFILEVHETNSYAPNDSIYYSQGLLLQPEDPPADIPPHEPPDDPPPHHQADIPHHNHVDDPPPHDLAADLPPHDPDNPHDGPADIGPHEPPPDDLAADAPPHDLADDQQEHEHIPLDDIGEEEHQELDNEDRLREEQNM